MATYFINGIAPKGSLGETVKEFFKRVDELEKVQKEKDLPKGLWYTEKDYDSSDFDMDYAMRQESLCWHGNNILRGFEKNHNNYRKLSEGVITVLRIDMISTTKAKIIYSKDESPYNSIPQKIEIFD